MATCGEVGDGPVILQLQKWGQLQFQLDLSEFCEASISPTRDLLLLLSYQCEALLLPLQFDRGSSSVLKDSCDSSDRRLSENLQASYSSEPTTICRSDLLDNSPCNSKPAEFVSDTDFIGRGSSTAFEYCPVISNVKSLTWGHCGDAYSQFEDSGFRELLIISSDDCILVHAFRYPNKSLQIFGSEIGAAHGKWVEWGPTHNTVKEQFSHLHSFENLNNINGSCGTTGCVDEHSKIGDVESSSSRLTRRNWFRTFFTKMDTAMTCSKYMARFPATSSLPQSADVISFNIYDSTLAFLEFLTSTSPLPDEKKQSVETLGPVSSLPTSDASHDIPSMLHHKSGPTGISYKCSRVFSSSSHRLIGFVLASPENISIGTSEDHPRISDKVLVVVVMLYQWGMQWSCAVDLQDLHPGTGPSPEWADFQFSDNFLVCLNTSGLICIWGAKTGNLVANFDVLQSSGLDLRVYSRLKRQKLSVNKDLTPGKVNLDGEVDQESRIDERETCGRHLECAKIFRKLMVASHSSLLAVIDEHGVAYIICAVNYISKMCDTFNQFMHPSQQSDCGMLDAWHVAGCEINVQKVVSDLSCGQGLSSSNMSVDDFSNDNHITCAKLRKRKQHIVCEESQMYSSGFSTASQINGWKASNAESEMSSAPVRRIFLPLNRFNKKDYIFFSPSGITRLVRSCNMKEQKSYKIIHTGLHVVSSVHDDRDLETCCLSKRSFTKESAFVGESIGCSFQGCFYLVTADGISIVLPSVSVSSSVLPSESIRYWQPSTATGNKFQFENLLVIDEFKDLGMPWQIEILDRTLLYEGPKEAERIVLHNGWDLRIARVRRLQLALHYLKFEEIEQSLDMLVDVNLAEEGILRLLFTSVYQIFCKVGSGSEVTLASRLLALAACFATKMLRRYGLIEHNKDKFMYKVEREFKISYSKPWSAHRLDEISNSRRLYEMAQFLEVIRNLQCRLSSKGRMPGPALTDGTDAAYVVDADLSQDDSPLPIVTVDSSSGVVDTLQNQTKEELSINASALIIDNSKVLPPVESSIDVGNLCESYFSEGDAAHRRKVIPLENPKNMIARWEMDNIDLKTIVKDALHFGRLPLAVLQLHRKRQRELHSENEKESHDTFSEVRVIGRAIAYDLFLKGESGLAFETLVRLGEDTETILRQLLFGTVRRSLRAQIAEEMKKYGYLTLHEWKMLERISLIERLYPSFSFWKTYLGRQKDLSSAVSSSTLPEDNNLILSFHLSNNLTIDCGDVDGVVIGSWVNVDNVAPVSETCVDNGYAGYWACAAVWSDAWDQRTFDRIILDQPFHMGVHVPWESQLEYQMSHNDMEEIYKLLDVIPTSLLLEGTIKINLESSHSDATISTEVKDPDHAMYICTTEELEPVCIDIPNVKIFKLSAVGACSSSWLKMLLEQELAKKYIFLKECWDSTIQIMPLLARAGIIIDSSKIFIRNQCSASVLNLDVMKISEKLNRDTGEALHKLVVHFCTQYNLPNLLDLYLNHHNLIGEDDSICSLLESAGDCQWAKWLLFSRVKGREYEASLSNARSNLSRQMIHLSNLSVLEIDEIIRTVDDMAEGGGEMVALATLMYSTAPMQKCLCSGSVNTHCNFSSQCTLENLRPGLQHFPTLWRTLVSACFGQDDNGYHLSSSAMFGKSTFSDYLTWRDTIFSSAGGDTSLIQMLPCWFPKSIRRLVKLYVQGPLGWQSLSGYNENTYVVNTNGNAGVSPINWEAAIQKSVEELYSSLEEKGFGVEHHLHRGRALSAFNHILGIRALKLRSTNVHQGPSGQTNVQSDVQAILAPLSQSEGPLLSSVMPLAIMHYDDSILVASCSFLLELCGLSASMLRVDVAALRRISSYFTSAEHNGHHGHVSPRGSAFLAVSHEGDVIGSLVKILADNYIHNDHPNVLEQKHLVSKGKQPSRSLMTVLQHLEKASLPLMDESKTCGYWLSRGNGDGFEFRSQQKAASLCWNLVTAFCQMHHLPLSTKYLAFLANDNDWVGFLTESQLGGFSVDVTIQVAAKEFSDPRLKTHILTVLKSMQSTKKKMSSSMSRPTSGSNEVSSITDNNNMASVELFGLLADCERQKNAGQALLVKAKDLRWSLLAMIASCFPDVSPLSCLTVWLEITAARETSSIKVNDISSKLAKGVGAAVEATNTLPVESRGLTFRYNRKSPKRRRLMEPTLGNSTVDAFLNIPKVSSPTVFSIAQEIASEEESSKMIIDQSKVGTDSDELLASLSSMVAVLCEQHLFLPLLRAFEMFLPSCSLLPFIRCLQAFSQMRLSEASAHLASFSTRVKEEPFLMQINVARDGLLKTAWISSTAIKAADAMLSTCPSAYEKRCLLQLLAAADFGDGGSASAYFRRHYWKINLAEPSLRKDDDAYLGNEILDDAALLTALEKNGRWEQARNWARQLESSGASWKSAVHHVTEAQAEAMVAEWKEYLWDVPEERAALWSHCQTLFVRYSFPALQAGLFFLKHAEAIEKEIPARELHEMLLLSLQWLSGTITQSNPVYPLHLLREIETRVWLLSVESEAQSKDEGDFTLPNSIQNLVGGNCASSIIEQTATVITKMDSHMNAMRLRATERNGARENSLPHHRNVQVADSSSPVTVGCSTRTKRRAKTYLQIRRPIDNVDNNNDSDDYPNYPLNFRNSSELPRNQHMQEENVKIEASLAGWEEKVRPAEMERAVLSLLEFGQIAAAKQLQQKLSPTHVPSELVIVDAALKLAVLSSSSCSAEITYSALDPEVISVTQSLELRDNDTIDPLQVLESLATKCHQGCGRGLCWRIIAVVRVAKILGLTFSEAFEKQPIELLQLLSLKAQDSLEEAKLLVQTHVIPPSNIARILAESFLKGLLAAHRGGYIDFQREEGPAPLLWRFSDFLKWAELCPSEPEIGHALMRLVMTGQEIPHACEVELLILSHHFYKSSACLDGVDVLVTLAANRVESYVLEGDFSCLARLVTGVSNFHALNFILNILVENGQLELLLQKYSTVDSATGKDQAVVAFRMAVLTSLKLFNPQDLDAFSMVYNHFGMKHETAALLESQSMQYIHQWSSRRDKDRQTEDLLEAMRHLIEAAEVHSSIDAGHKTYCGCARASLLSLQIRIPDLNWLELSETNARRVLVEQSRFQEALIVAEAYNLNNPSEWAPVLWNQMLKPDLIEQFVAEFVAVLPLQPSMLYELARFYRAEVAARGDQSHFSVWLSPGGLPAEWVKHLGRSFRSLLRRTRDLRVRVQVASIATGFGDIIDACAKVLDKVPDGAGPLILRRGHGGAFLPLM